MSHVIIEKKNPGYFLLMVVLPACIVSTASHPDLPSPMASFVQLAVSWLPLTQIPGTLLNENSRDFVFYQPDLYSSKLSTPKMHVQGIQNSIAINIRCTRRLGICTLYYSIAFLRYPQLPVALSSHVVLVHLLPPSTPHPLSLLSSPSLTLPSLKFLAPPHLPLPNHSLQPYLTKILLNCT